MNGFAMEVLTETLVTAFAVIAIVWLFIGFAIGRMKGG